MGLDLHSLPGALETLKRLTFPVRSDCLDELTRVAAVLAPALEDASPAPEAVRAAHTVADLLSGCCESLSGSRQAVLASLKGLLLLGRPGWLAASAQVQTWRNPAEMLGGRAESLGAEARFYLLHELLRRHWTLERSVSVWARAVLETLGEAPPRDILKALGVLDRLGDTPAFPLRETLLRGSFRNWLERLLRDPLSGDELAEAARAVRGLGHPDMSRRLARLVATHPERSTAEVMEILSRCLEAGETALSQAVRAVLKVARNGRVAHCMDILIGINWPRTGQALALFCRKDPGLRRAMAARAATLPEAAFENFLEAFKPEVRPAILAETLAFIARADTDFLRACLAVEAGSEGLPEALDRYLERMETRPDAVARASAAQAARESGDPAAPRKGLFSMLLGEKRPELGETLVHARMLKDKNFGGAELTGAVVEERTLQNVVLTGAAFDEVSLIKCRLLGVDFAGARLRKTVFQDCLLSGVRFEGAVLEQCRFSGCVLEGCDFSGAMLEGGGLDGCDLSHCRFGEASLEGCAWNESEGRHLGLAGASLRQAAFTATDLEASDFSLAALESCRFEGVLFTDCLLRDTAVLNCSFVECRTVDCLFPGCRVRESDALEPALLQARADTLRRRLLEAQTIRLELPPEEGTALHGPAVRRWVRQWALGRFERRMLGDNARRQRLALRRMTPGQAEFFRLLPWLLHSRHFETRDAIENVPSCVLAGYRPDLETLRLARKHFAGVTPPETQARPVLLEAVYAMGSLGSIAQTDASDMDIWVCYDPEGVGPAEDARLRRKLEAVAAWAQAGFGAEVHFFLMSLPSVRANDFGFSDSESAGTAQALLLKEEFYRTALRVAGKEPLWWLTPPGADRETWESYGLAASRSPLLGPGRVVDLGRLDAVPPEEFFGASLWQIVKGLHSPYKSVMKLGLLEKYAGRDASGELMLCDQIKDAVTRRSPAWQADPYTVLFRNLRDYYRSLDDQEAVDLLTESFTLKAGIGSFDVSLGFPCVEEERSFLTFLSGKEEISEEAVRGLGQTWSFARSMTAGATLSRFLIKTYERIQERLEQGGERAGARISPEDLTRLGRKIQANFAPRKHKVERVPFLDLSGHLFPEFYFEAEKAPGRRTVWLARGQEAGSGKISSKDMQVLRKDTDPALLLAWLVVNGLYSPSTHVHGERSIAPMSVDDLKKSLQALYEFFPRESTFEVDMEETLRPERVTRAFFILNLAVPQDAQKIVTASVVYATNWGEVFCLTVRNPDQKILKQASSFLRDVLPQPLPQPPEMGLYIPRKSQCPRIRLL
ncbi:MAG TPA: class I adenylate cyclase [Desulfovibrio sp.]|uniref:class I adenylate cyclase n=1 Tax=Desulfovibrio sp. TaxID=885 RepID=UPI002BAC463B|nr:class I adenylate cyclase [Desulfovibrio sp.]HMM38058.1 class I adenylate cyclase [Desulfovibrio sp.]